MRELLRNAFARARQRRRPACASCRESCAEEEASLLESIQFFVRKRNWPCGGRFPQTLIAEWFANVASHAAVSSFQTIGCIMRSLTVFRKMTATAIYALLLSRVRSDGKGMWSKGTLPQFLCVLVKMFVRSGSSAMSLHPEPLQPEQLQPEQVSPATLPDHLVSSRVA